MAVTGLAGVLALWLEFLCCELIVANTNCRLVSYRSLSLGVCYRCRLMWLPSVVGFSEDSVGNLLDATAGCTPPRIYKVPSSAVGVTLHASFVSSIFG